MLTLLRFLRALVLLPLRLSLLTAIVVVAATFMLGLWSPRVAKVGSKAVAWGAQQLSMTTTCDTFDPMALEDPENELEFLNAISKAIAPDLCRAKYLLRRQRADVHHWKSSLRSLKEKPSMAPPPAKTATGGEAAQRATDGPRRGDQWTLVINEKVAALDRLINCLLEREKRVDLLIARLSERRELILCGRWMGWDEDDDDDCGFQGGERMQALEEIYRLLAGVEKTATKALLVLNPSFMNDEPPSESPSQQPPTQEQQQAEPDKAR
jgi:hypothetical protein